MFAQQLDVAPGAWYGDNGTVVSLSRGQLKSVRRGGQAIWQRSDANADSDLIIQSGDIVAATLATPLDPDAPERNLDISVAGRKLALKAAVTELFSEAVFPETKLQAFFDLNEVQTWLWNSAWESYGSDKKKSKYPTAKDVKKGFRIQANRAFVSIFWI